MVNPVSNNLKLGVDIGGTFTDLVLVNEETKQLFVGKELTTTDDPSRAVIQGLKKLLDSNQLLVEDLNQITHATTLITNAVIERDGAQTGLVTTEGFRDVLEMAREVKYDLYDIFLPMPKPIIPRSLRTEVPERTTAEGEVLNSIKKEELEKKVDHLVSNNVESIAVCFLHSYQNSENEKMAAEFIRQRYPDLHISISSEIAPEIREYERMNTTAANAYVQPLTKRYLKRLTGKLEEKGFDGKIYIMLSNGGLTGIKNAATNPIQLLESGPAAGTLVGGFYARHQKDKNVMTFDMGGTTAKLCMVDDGKPDITYTFEAARERRFESGSGLPVRVPSVDLIEIGAGGGSIAKVDELGLLKVGPESAGSWPGPACYGRGGTEPTVTDANLVLGYYNAEFFLGGEMKLDQEASRTAIARVANELGVSIEEAAWGIHNIANEQMASAARIHAAEKGKDPRPYTLMATGGAGPCHASGVGQKLQLHKVVCPPSAGVASAFGLLVAPPRLDLVRSMMVDISELNINTLITLYEQMESDAYKTFEDMGVDSKEIQFIRSVDMRYVGQGFEIQVPIQSKSLSTLDVNQLANMFENTYQQTFGRVIEGAPVEALTWRLKAIGPSPSVDFIAAQQKRSRILREDASRGCRLAYFPHWKEYREVQIFDRYALGIGVEGAGPAIIEEWESTAVVPPGATWRIDKSGALIITLGGIKNETH